ncbi:MAG: glycosyltransferase family 39 protein [Sedimentisphaerales bacterium]|nr:glycosyltransferase family 39 protein [Sedimentisphaerales bacterium]
MSGVSSGKFVLSILLLWFVLYIPSLGHAELKGEEGRRAMPGIQMLQTGNWLIPHIGGEPYFNKPPMTNWLVAMSVRLCGSVSEFSVRLPAAIFVLILALVLIITPTSLPLLLRFLAAILFLTCFTTIEKGRVIEIEGLLLSLTGLTCFWWLFCVIDSRSPLLSFSVPALAMSVALLMKGPVAYLPFYCLLLGVYIHTKDRKYIISWSHLFCLLFSLAALYSWYQAVDNSGMADKLARTAKQQMGGRVMPEEIDWGNWFETAILSPRIFLPWLLLLPCCWQKKYIVNIPGEHLQFYFGLRTALVIALIVHNAFPGTMTRYSMPTVPLAMLLLAWALYYNKALESADKYWSGLLTLLLYASPATAAAVAFRYGYNFISLTTLFFVVLLSIIILRGKLFRRAKTELVLLTAILIAMGVNIYTSASTLIDLDPYSRRETADAIENVIPDDKQLYICNPGYQPFVFYLDSQKYHYIAAEAILAERPEYLLIREGDYQALALEVQTGSMSYAIVLDFIYRENGRFLLLRSN